jgi:hypothetical protein
MSSQHVQEVPVILADQQAARQLKQAVDSMSTVEATRFASSAGVPPPTDEPDWELLVRAEPDGSESLVWVLVREDEDE